MHVYMKKKLTLVIDDEVIDRAKRLARSRGGSRFLIGRDLPCGSNRGRGLDPAPEIGFWHDLPVL